ncbi:hypothetical protein QNI19_15780 [Cytophagaceae bacterium DM2B3-1]|uniref:Mobilization protein n=1 Tax=Xanthocytophaga flava TaxID=3048013 RepID=A0ABT7CKY5_9BACT|nr:hypothetical protein [Xanthocytophaga flavus]MDJ1494404.1 hypothetical protein [Xanthocytophaga flavus]
MSKYHTNSTSIRKYRSEYYRLRAYEARLNEQLHHMKKRIRQIQQDEEQSLATQALLVVLLAHATQRKAELEVQPASKERNKQLKKAEKEFKEVNAKYKRNEYHLAVVEKKKDKDNTAKYILKEAKRDDVTARIQAAHDVWKKFEQIEQQEEADFNAFKAMQLGKKEENSITVNQVVSPFNTKVHLSPRIVSLVQSHRQSIQDKNSRQHTYLPVRIQKATLPGIKWLQRNLEKAKNEVLCQPDL